MALIGVLAVAVTPSASFDSWTYKGWDMIWWGLSALTLPVVMLTCVIAIRRLLPKLWIAVTCNIVVFLIALVVVAAGVGGGIAYIQGHPWLA